MQACLHTDMNTQQQMSHEQPRTATRGNPVFIRSCPMSLRPVRSTRSYPQVRCLALVSGVGLGWRIGIIGNSTCSFSSVLIRPVSCLPFFTQVGLSSSPNRRSSLFVDQRQRLLALGLCVCVCVFACVRVRMFFHRSIVSRLSSSQVG